MTVDLATSHSVIPCGFRGDAFLLRTVHTIVQQAGIRSFVETGAFYGMTTRHMARSYPHVACHSCEPNQERYHAALALTAGLPNCAITAEESPAPIERLAVTDCVNRPTLFWLDAHGYGFQWPLRREIELITNHWQTAYILIDDFRVPGRPYFDFDEYEGQECSYQAIQDAVNPRRAIQVWYPHYSPQCATWPLRGWGLLVLDDREAGTLWRPDQWLEAGRTVAQHGTDREAQQAYWDRQLHEAQQSDQAECAWDLLAQQVPHWMVGRVGEQMLQQSWYHPGAWQTIALRLASDMDVAAAFSLFANMPCDAAESALYIFCKALESGGRSTLLCYLHDLPPVNCARRG